ncbi:hypothetical protein [Fibrobacter sp.]|uniref:hypothetical protein n=1 Tax=Fibrobacter sp. TaxID=35828 RepID=UPI00388F8ED3
MSTAQVLDTHRLMYRNARLRAISLSDRTTPIQFLNVTDDDTAAEIGNIVYTDGCGYVFYGADHRRVSCLAVAESAIVQVDLHNNNNWNDIEWIVRVEDGSEFVRVDGVGKVIDVNGNLLWNPLQGDWSPFPDFMRRDEFNEGEWAEGEMTVTDTTPKQLNVDKWTHTIIVKPGHANEYEISIANGRAGQCIAIVNVSDTSVTITETHAGGSSSQTISAKGAIIAVRSISANQWVLRAFDEGEMIVGARNFLWQLLSVSDYNTWIAETQAKINDNNGVVARNEDGIADLPPRSIAFTGRNKILYTMNTDGLIVPITDSVIQYAGTGIWRMYQRNVVPSPAHIVKVAIDGSAFPEDHPFGSYSGINDLYIDLQMCFGETLHVFITVPNDITWSLSREIHLYVNGCQVYTTTTAILHASDCLVSGRIERAYDEETHDTWYFWTPDSEVVKAG